MRTDIRTTLLRTFVEDVPRNLARFDEATGRFLTEGGWAVTNQDHVYPLALLYTTEHPDNPYYQDASILDRALRGGDALRDFQYPDGQVEFIKVDDSTWGPIYMPWSMYHWLETYALLREIMDAERRARWETGLTLAYDGITANLASGRVHNIPAWNAMASYRAGQLFARADWRDAGRQMIARTVAEQMPGGYWLEHHGPTPAYNVVYAHALGLYHYFSGDESVLPALERATDFHIRYTYPDGRQIETIDGRVKYHDRINVHGLSAFSLFPRGRGYVRLLFEQWLAERAQHPLPHLVYNQTADGPRIASGEYGLSARLAPLFHHYGTLAGDVDEAPIPQEQATYFIDDPAHALLRRQDQWFTCLSGVVTPVVESRWGQDRQSFVSIWHATTGLLVGGGNAKEQPMLSTFVVDQNAADPIPPTVPAATYLPSQAELQSSGDVDEVTLHYGDHRCTVQIKIESPQRLRLTFAGAGKVDAVAHLPFKLQLERPLETAAGTAHKLDHTPLQLDAAKAGGTVRHGAWQVQMPAGSHLQWPVFAFNPYAADGAGSLEEAAAVLTVPLPAAQIEPVTVLIEVPA